MSIVSTEQPPVEDEPRSVRLNLRLNPAARRITEQVAREQSLLGGPGLKPGEPNLSAAVRWLMSRADPRFREVELDLDWDRTPK